MRLTKAVLQEQIDRLEALSKEAADQIQPARWSNRESDAQYHEGQRVAYLRAAMLLQSLL